MEISHPKRKIIALLLFGMLLINVFIVIPETMATPEIDSIKLISAYGMPTSILGLLGLTALFCFVCIVYCLSNLDNKFKIIDN